MENAPLLPLNPLDPDAPLEALMDIQGNPHLLNATPEQMKDLLVRLKSYVHQPTTLAAKIERDAGRTKGGAAKAERARKLADL